MKSRSNRINRDASAEEGPGGRKKSGQGIVRSGAVALLAVVCLGLALYQGLDLLADPLAGGRPTYQPSIRVEDRQGRLLREFLSSRETRSQWIALNQMSPHVVGAALAAEDRRFFSHPGLDPLALVRAVWMNIEAGRVVSGASTITMQLARVLRPGPRTWRRKAAEALMALRIEKSHSKREILEEYLNRVPCGNLVHGLPAASRLYLDKSPQNLTPAESAFLMSLPQAPSLLNPYKDPGPALARRNRILDRMADLGLLDGDAARRARAEPLSLKAARSRFRAPHFALFIRSLLPDPAPGRVRTTLDLELQSQIERLVNRTVAESGDKGISQAAVVVMDHRTREVLAWVGSADFFDPRDGQNDGVRALRQPGSAVKPLTYAAAFDNGLNPATMIEDGPVDFGLSRGVYSPRNYDGRFRGEVSLRTALASSLNVPAVKVLSKVGLTKVHGLMKAAGLDSLVQEPEFYGLGLTLGCGEVSLLELANAYATLASGGIHRPPVLFHTALEPKKTPEETRVFSSQAAYLATDVLGDDAARASGFGRDSLLALPFPAAAKTGTSKNFRDNWTVGYTTSVVVAVWAGNFDASPMGRVSGITGAGPLWRKVTRLCAAYYPAGRFERPAGMTEMDVCTETGLRAGPDCPTRRTEIFMETCTPPGYCLHHGPVSARNAVSKPAVGRLAILSPRTGEQYLFDPGIETGFQNLGLAAQVPEGLECLVWFVNGREVARLKADLKPLPEIFTPLKSGLMTVRLDGIAGGRRTASDQVSVQVH
ncbi:MAG: penicillin-binding protein 1C [Proteobacteria bacterium]|nr:penicillin-binding protein 1C [Pseudomonadota bacterium]